MCWRDKHAVAATFFAPEKGRTTDTCGRVLRQRYETLFFRDFFSWRTFVTQMVRIHYISFCTIFRKLRGSVSQNRRDFISIFAIFFENDGASVNQNRQNFILFLPYFSPYTCVGHWDYSSASTTILYQKRLLGRRV